MRPFRQPAPPTIDIAESNAPILAGNSVQAHTMRQLVGLVAGAHDPILLTGPAGAGKQALARAIHDLSPLSHCPFIEAGAGRLEDIFAARWEGTLYIPAIDLMPVSAQLALLRWMESNQTHPVRLIASSQKGIDQETVIAPLHLTLSRLRIPCAPLQNRQGDIPIIVQRMWMDDPDRLAPIVEPKGWALLARHHATRSYRELEANARRLQHIFGGQQVSSSQIQPLLGSNGKAWLDNSNFNLKQHLAQEERRYLVEALLRSNGVVAAAAASAGLKRTTFLAKMKRHGLLRP